MNRLFSKDGKCNGEYKEYHDNGQLIRHCYYKDGNLDGEYKSWYDNGYYKDDKLEGEYKRWHDNGRLYIHTYYIDGTKYPFDLVRTKIKKQLSEIDWCYNDIAGIIAEYAI